VVLVSLAVLLGTTSCGGDPRSIAGFCRLLRREGALLTDTSDPAGLAQRYRDLDSHAPLQIKDEWHTITVLMGRVTTYDPTSDADTQSLLNESLRAKSAIVAVADWADRKCKLALGHLGTPSDTVVSDSEVPGTDAVVGTMAP
jgi:hypothetical protein